MEIEASPHTTIRALVEVYPRTFVAESSQVHLPLARGIDKGLAAAGVLAPAECRVVLRTYVSRYCYLRALGLGGARYGLDGAPAGEVTAEEMSVAQAAVAAIEAKGAEQGRAAGAAWKAEKAARAAQKAKDVPERASLPPATVAVPPAAD
jgi:ProP effector